MSISWSSTEPMFANPAAQNDSGVSYVQNFHVKYDISNRVITGTEAGKDVQLIEASALLAPGVPRYGSVFKGNKAAFCRGLSSRIHPDETSNIPSNVLVTCNFRAVSVERKDEETDPLLKAPDISWGTHFENEAIQNANVLKVMQGGKEVFKLQKAGVGGKLQQINNFVIPITNSCGQILEVIGYRSFSLANSIDKKGNCSNTFKYRILKFTHCIRTIQSKECLNPNCHNFE